MSAILHAFTEFAGACLVLAVAGVIFLGLVCWARDIAEEWARRHRQGADK